MKRSDAAAGLAMCVGAPASQGGSVEAELKTHAWATWKNVGRSVGRSVVFQEETRSGDIIVQPRINQQVVSDIIGDTPLANYDVTTIAVAENGADFQFSFYTAAEIGPKGAPLEFIIYIDSDCNPETGARRGNRGVEHWLRYRHNIGAAHIYDWDAEQGSWDNRRSIEFDAPDGATMSIRVPNEYINTDQQFCWSGAPKSNGWSGAPRDWLGSSVLAVLVRIQT